MKKINIEWNKVCVFLEIFVKWNQIKKLRNKPKASEKTLKIELLLSLMRCC